MGCYGLTFPGSEASLFQHSTAISSTPPITSRPDTIIHFKPFSRFPNSSFKTKSADRDTIVVNLSFYEILGIPESGSLTEIKQAYKKLARKYNSYLWPPPPDEVEEYSRMFIKIKEAYDTLSDPIKRAVYDEYIHHEYSDVKCNQEEVSRAWMNHWEAQASGLEIRSMNNMAEEKRSWAAQIRREN
ncbi:chaperone protein dnaJ 20, chloroplastic-like [Euphorbia lathyris]|uniref:chaperone protein dnaJ 20, chloroplastic-like n=1 Tax=Euphorbia lathyris TaxID=212925 RepID=UPI0033142354